MTDFAPHTGRTPALTARRWIILAAGLAALCLQLMAQVLPPDAMRNVMRLAAVSADEAQSFANTCLNAGSRDDGQPGQSDNHANCPVCLTLLQAQGFATAPTGMAITIAWIYQPLPMVSAPFPAPIASTASFASRAPPAAIG